MSKKIASLATILFFIFATQSCNKKQIKKLKGDFKKLQKKYSKLLKGKKSKFKKKKRKKKKTKTVKRGSDKAFVAKGKKGKKGKSKTKKKLIFEPNVDKALSLAKKEKRDVLIIITSEHCPPCKAMKNSVFPDPAVKKLFTKYIIVADKSASGIKEHTDIYINKYWDLLSENGTVYTPTFAILKANGKVKKKFVGSMGKSSFKKFLK